ncbi:MAG: hypothetical protein Q8934_09450 [Bacillota bacterium]|nr:hypothetical protein [Bacillota bacterium]
MQKLSEIQEKETSLAEFQFIFPFSFKKGCEITMFPFLKNQHFKPFRLDHLEDENLYYGRFHVSHREMEAYFLAFTNQILFPHSEHQKGIQRFSKALNLKAKLTSELVNIPFQIHSIDVTLCPYELGFITIRTELQDTKDLPLSVALEFAACFRTLEPLREREKDLQIDCGGRIFYQVEKFVFEFLFDGLAYYFEEKKEKGSYFQTFPYFEDQRMYVQTLIVLKQNEDIDFVDVYRASGLCGLTKEGKPFISANNFEYIQDFLNRKGYLRWAPNRYFVMEEHMFTCLTNEDSEKVLQIAGQMYGEFYYSLILNLFHKIVLLKLAYTYAELNIQRDTKEMERLLYSINSFTANYFSLELVSESQSQDIFFHLRKAFSIELLHKIARQNVEGLFKYQENVNSKKDSLLLLILTLYSVIGEMFGMSLVTSDFAGKIKWGHIFTYNPIEYFALFLAISGLGVSLILGIQGIYHWILDLRNRKNWVKETVLSSTIIKKE